MPAVIVPSLTVWTSNVWVTAPLVTFTVVALSSTVISELSYESTPYHVPIYSSGTSTTSGVSFPPLRLNTGLPPITGPLYVNWPSITYILLSIPTDELDPDILVNFNCPVSSL